MARTPYRDWSEERKEKARERNRKYHLAHPGYCSDYYHAHKEQMNAAVNEWREQNPERVKLQRQRRKLVVLEKLGNRCVICGETDIRVLQIDHIAGDGAEDRRINGNSRDSFYRRIMNDPEAHLKFQLLCANDNWRKRWDNGEY